MSDNLHQVPEQLYALLVARIATKEQSRGLRVQALVEYCPFCGADNDKHLRASFGRIFDGGGYGFHCFACGRSCSLYHLAHLTGVTEYSGDVPFVTKRKPDKEPEYPSWFGGRDSLQHGYTNNADLAAAWGHYKGITPDMAKRYGLGYGVLPGDYGNRNKCPHNRLITPILDNSGRVAWFRGRAIDCDCGKWLAAPLRDFSMAGIGVALPQSQYSRRGGAFFVVENYTDAAIINSGAKYSAVATLSTSYWLPQWTNQLFTLNPDVVYVAFDNDLAGNGGTLRDVENRGRKIAARQNGIPESQITIIRATPERTGYTVDYKTNNTQGIIRVPTPRGVILANHLLDSGFNVILMKWPKSESDMGDYLTRGDL